jgi:hypothetical protein
MPAPIKINRFRTARTYVREGRAVFGLTGFGLAVVLGGMAVVAGAIGGLVWYNRARSGMPTGSPRVAVTDTVPQTAAGEAAEPDGVFYRALDGAPKERDAAERPYYAVMIDNSADARPPSGLQAAGVVYEAPVEAGITRFMAVFAADAAFEKVGPVRSARPYFIDWASEYDAVYVHVGGSPEAMERLRASDEVVDLNEFFHGAEFWRASDRVAPHNAYTGSTLLADFGERAVAFNRDFTRWNFKSDMAESERPVGGSLRIGARTAAYESNWEYDAAANAYAHALGARGHVDAESGQRLHARNVLVQFAEVEVIDSVGRRRVETGGGGDAIMALDGFVYRGTWRKDETLSRTMFYDASGNPIRLNRGLTWVAVVPLGTNVDYEMVEARGGPAE